PIARKRLKEGGLRSVEGRQICRPRGCLGENVTERSAPPSSFPDELPTGTRLAVLSLRGMPALLMCRRLGRALGCRAAVPLKHASRKHQSRSQSGDKNGTCVLLGTRRMRFE